MKYAVPSAMLLANLVMALITATMWDLDASLGAFLFFTVFLVVCESSFLVLLLEIAGLGKTDPELEAKEEWIARAPFASQLSAAFGKLAIGSLTIFGLLLVFHMIVQGILRAAEVNTAGTLGLALQIVSHVIGLIGGVLMMLHGHKLAKWRPVSTSLFIFRKEFIAYFHSPVAYIVISAFLLVIGFLFFQQFFLAGQVSLRPMFSMIAVAFVFISPAITMRLIAEEKRAGTIELLMTLPVGPAQIVIGKYLAALGLIAVALLLTLPYALTVSSMGNLDWGAVVGGYIGLLFLGASYLALGTLCSTWTNSQIVAVILGWVTCLAFWLLASPYFTMILPSPIASAAEFLSPGYHFENIIRGVIDSRNIIYYLTFISGTLMLAIHFMTTEKWR